MNVKILKNVPGLSSKFIISLKGCSDEDLIEINQIENNYISVIIHDTSAMLIFKREQDFNWYSLKWNS